jgi:hypothetical protein
VFFLSVAVQRFAACLVSFSRDTCVQAGVDSAWEQEKLEASLSWRSPREKCLPQVPQNPQRPVHAVSGGGLAR